jgi:hypothetical protein
MPHPQWQRVSSFPKHFHAGDQRTVIDSDIEDDPEQGFIQFLKFAKGRIA